MELDGNGYLLGSAHDGDPFAETNSTQRSDVHGSVLPVRLPSLRVKAEASEIKG